jgi:hypothetical protein
MCAESSAFRVPHDCSLSISSVSLRRTDQLTAFPLMTTHCP